MLAKITLWAVDITILQAPVAVYRMGHRVG